jgi:hypothetical protein
MKMMRVRMTKKMVIVRGELHDLLSILVSSCASIFLCLFCKMDKKKRHNCYKLKNWTLYDFESLFKPFSMNCEFVDCPVRSC